MMICWEIMNNVYRLRLNEITELLLVVAGRAKQAAVVSASGSSVLTTLQCYALASIGNSLSLTAAIRSVSWVDVRVSLHEGSG